MFSRAKICQGLTGNGNGCKAKTKKENGYCHLHQKQSLIPEGEENCCVCLENAYKNDALECGHLIHSKCLENWSKAECPVCRKELKHIPIQLRRIIEKNERKIREDRDREARQNITQNELLFVNAIRGFMTIIPLLMGNTSNSTPYNSDSSQLPNIDNIINNLYIEEMPEADPEEVGSHIHMYFEDN